jgi:hypothetical protein
VSAARASFAQVDPAHELAARTLGAGPWRAFRRVSVPLAARGLLAGAVVTWARAVSEFGAVVVLAYHPRTAATLAYERFTGYGLAEALPGGGRARARRARPAGAAAGAARVTLSRARRGTPARSPRHAQHPDPARAPPRAAGPPPERHPPRGAALLAARPADGHRDRIARRSTRPTSTSPAAPGRAA